jgi:hypothetical protein
MVLLVKVKHLSYSIVKVYTLEINKLPLLQDVLQAPSDIMFPKISPTTWDDENRKEIPEPRVTLLKASQRYIHDYPNAKFVIVPNELKVEERKDLERIVFDDNNDLQRQSDKSTVSC